MKNRAWILAVFAMTYITFSSDTLATAQAESQAQPEEIIITAFDYPPYMDESARPQGLFSELVAAAFEAVNIQVNFQFLPLKRSTSYVLTGKALGQMGTIWNFPPEQHDLLDTVAIFYYQVVGFYLKDRVKNVQFSSLEDLRPYELGTIRGSSDAAILAQDPLLKVSVMPTMAHLFQALYQSRRYDLLFTVQLSGLSFIQRHYPKDIDRWQMTQDAVQGLLAQVVFSKQYPDYQRYMHKLQNGLDTIIANGRYQEIFSYYYGGKPVPNTVLALDRPIYNLPIKHTQPQVEIKP